MPEGWETRAEQVRALVRGALGEEPAEVAHCRTGGRSLTFDVGLAGRRVIVRTNADAQAFAGTERTLIRLAGLGLPVPRVLASDLSRVAVRPTSREWPSPSDGSCWTGYRGGICGTNSGR